MTQASNRSTINPILIMGTPLLMSSNLVFATDSSISNDSTMGIVIAAMSGAAFVTAIWAMLLGRKSMQKDRDFVNTLKQNIVKEQRRIDNSMRGIKMSEDKANEVLEKLIYQNKVLMSKQHSAWLSSEKIDDLAHKSELIESELQRKGKSFERFIEQTQMRWNERLNETENTVLRVDQDLNEGLKHLDAGIKRVQQQDAHSYQLAQHITTQHNIQLSTLEANNELSDKVKKSLNLTLQESTKLLEHLRDNQEKTDKAYTSYMESIGQYESDLYGQYDIAFQNADMARQELDANLSEGRLHVETLRRYEEQSRTVKENTEKNLKQLDIKSINQLADTLNTTQQTFDNLSHKVSEAQETLKSLNSLDFTQGSNNSDSTDHTEAKLRDELDQNNENTLIPFFTKRKG